MPVNGEIVVTPEIYRAVINAILGKAILGHRLVGVVAAALGVLLLVTGSPNADSGAIGLIAGGLAVAVFLPWRVLSLGTRRAAPALAGPWRYEVGADNIRLTTPLASSEWAWKNLRSFDEHPDFWLARTLIRNQAVPLVKAAFSPADQRTIAELGARKFAGPANIS